MGYARGGQGDLFCCRRGHSRAHAAPCVCAVAPCVLVVPPMARQRRLAAAPRHHACPRAPAGRAPPTSHRWRPRPPQCQDARTRRRTRLRQRHNHHRAHTPCGGRYPGAPHGRERDGGLGRRPRWRTPPLCPARRRLEKAAAHRGRWGLARAAGGMGEPASARRLAGPLASGRGQRLDPAASERGGGTHPGVAQSVAPFEERV